VLWLFFIAIAADFGGGSIGKSLPFLLLSKHFYRLVQQFTYQSYGH
jgi:hypothetical protein